MNTSDVRYLAVYKNQFILIAIFAIICGSILAWYANWLQAPIIYDMLADNRYFILAGMSFGFVALLSYTFWLFVNFSTPFEEMPIEQECARRVGWVLFWCFCGTVPALLPLLMPLIFPPDQLQLHRQEIREAGFVLSLLVIPSFIFMGASLRGLLSELAMLTYVPFIPDPDPENLRKIKKLRTVYENIVDVLGDAKTTEKVFTDGIEVLCDKLKTDSETDSETNSKRLKILEDFVKNPHSPGQRDAMVRMLREIKITDDPQFMDKMRELIQSFALSDVAQESNSGHSAIPPVPPTPHKKKKRSRK